jgi:hypothetical protein
MIAVLQAQLAEIKAEGSLEGGYNGKDSVICSICGGRYTKANVSTHRKSRKHQVEAEHLEAIKRIIKSKTLDGR